MRSIFSPEDGQRIGRMDMIGESVMQVTLNSLASHLRSWKRFNDNSLQVRKVE